MILWLLALLILEGGMQFSPPPSPPGLQIVLTHREMCHGAAVCSCDPVQGLSFTRTASAWEQMRSREKKNTRHAAPEPRVDKIMKTLEKKTLK